MRWRAGRGAARLAVAATCAIALAGGSEVIAAVEASDQPPILTQRTGDEQSGPQLVDSPPVGQLQEPIATSAPAAVVGHRLKRGDWVAFTLAAVSLSLVVLTRWHRLHRAPQRPAALTPIAALVLLGGILLLGPMGSALAQTVLRISIPEGQTAASLPLPDLVKLLIAVSAARAVGVAAYVVMQRQARTPEPDRRASALGAWTLGLAGLMLTWPLVVASVSLAGWLTQAPAEPIAHDLLRQMQGQQLNGWSITLIVLVTVVGPIIEEVMYRGLLQEALRRAGLTRWPCIALASAAFAAAHLGVVEPHALIGLFMLGLGLGWAFEKAGSLWAPIAMHALFNACNIVLAQITT